MTLITDTYLGQQKAMHADPRGYGTRGDKWAAYVAGMANEVFATSILDYGCGQGSLGRAMRASGWPVTDYDPAIKGKDAPPEPADLVVCTDVLEHVEPDCIDAVLDDLKRVTRKRAFIVVSLVPAGKDLPDGRNAHILLQPREWWAEKLAHRFELVRVGPMRTPKGHKEFAALWAAVGE